MKIENTNNISFTAPTNMATAAAKKVEHVQPLTAVPAVSNENVLGKNPNDAVKQEVNINAPNKKKLDELADRLVGENTALVIEKDPNGVGFVYKSINRITGEVTRVWPREELASELASIHDVDARGIMINASA